MFSGKHYSVVYLKIILTGGGYVKKLHSIIFGDFELCASKGQEPKVMVVEFMIKAGLHELLQGVHCIPRKLLHQEIPL